MFLYGFQMLVVVIGWDVFWCRFELLGDGLLMVCVWFEDCVRMGCEMVFVVC